MSSASNHRPWVATAQLELRKTLSPVLQETNILDWKVQVSENKKRLNEHLSAFANQVGGGFFAFGIDPKGKPIGISQGQVDKTIKVLGDLSRQAVEPPILIDHEVVNFNGKNLLLVNVNEATSKPVRIRGKSIEESYVRSAGTTRKMSVDEVRRVIVESSGLPVEETICLRDLTNRQVTDVLFLDEYFTLLKKELPSQLVHKLQAFESEGLIKRNGDNWDVTRLCALLFSKNLKAIDSLAQKAVRLTLYRGKNNQDAVFDHKGSYGYVVSYPKLMGLLTERLPSKEEFGIYRERKLEYPPETIREIIVNSLIHQDLNELGGPTIEVYSDRIEFVNPGKSLVSPLRMIDEPPRSRNERLADMMYRLGMCERRGSGLDRAVFELEMAGLPAPKIETASSSTKVIIYGKRELSSMRTAEKVNSCYNHAVIQKCVNQVPITNSSVRKRFGLKDSQASLATKIISETIKKGMIKLHDPESKSKKHVKYVPFWDE